MKRTGFQLFYKSIFASYAWVHSVEIGAPVEISLLKVQSGDLHSLQTIPSSIAKDHS